MLKNVRDQITHFIISLRLSLLSIFTILFLLTATVFLSIFYIHVSEIVERAALLLMDEASELTLEEFNNDFQPFMLASFFSEELIKDKILRVGDSQQVAGYLLDILKEYPLAERAHWYDGNGDLIYAWREKNGAITTEIISNHGNKQTDDFFYHDLSGALTKHITKKPNLNWRGSVGYSAALEKKRSIWTNVFIYQHPPHYLGVSLATPVFDAERSLEGVLEIDLRLNEFSQKLAQHEISEHGKVLVINKDGNIIAAPELADKNEKPTDKIVLPNIQHYSDPWIREAYRLYQTNRKATFNFKYKGTQYLATFRPIPIFADDKWIISIVVPASDFSRRVHEVERTYMLVFFLIFLVGLALISNLVSRVVSPIKKLVSETQKIRLFDLEGGPRIKSHIKEVIDLSEAMYAMKAGLRSFQKYVPSGLVRQLIYAGEDAHIGGMKRDLAILFTDIKDFTEITDTNDTDQLIKQIYEYFEALAPVITKNYGTIDKYIGDAMMAFWGAPLIVDEPCHLAARAALQSQTIIRTLNARWDAENKPKFVTRIGLHYGNTIVGNIGSSERLNYTVLGNAVNMTNRLINANKIYGTSILVSESVYQQIKGRFALRFVDKVILKGAQSSMDIYELLGAHKDKLEFDLAAYISQFQQAFAHYQKQAWHDAILLFKECLNIYPEDTLAPIFIRRCEAFQKNPPPSWTGTWHMTEK